MSDLLLDTNVFAMVLTDDPRLSRAAQARLASANQVFLSVVSFYEIGQKVRLGKWPVMEPFMATLEARAIDDGYQILPLDGATALDAALLDWAHRDPFDRMIAALARRQRLPLVSSDRAFDWLGIERIWDEA